MLWSYLVVAMVLIAGCGGDPLGQLISNKAKDTHQQNTAPVCPEAITTASTLGLVSSKRVFLDDREAYEMSYQTLSHNELHLVVRYSSDCEGGPSSSQLLQDMVVSAAIANEELEEWAAATPCVLSITESRNYQITGLPEDPEISEQMHFNAIHASEAYDLFFDSKEGISTQDGDVTIAIIDSGVDLEHEDLKDNIWRNLKEVPGNNVDDDKNGYVDDVEGWNFAAKAGQKSNDPRPITWEDSPGDESHGTHVAGLAAAAWNNEGGGGILGKNVKIMALNAFGDSSAGSTSRLNLGIRYAADNGADIINLSVGACKFDRATYDTILYAICKGSMVVTAAGNNYYLVNGEIVGKELSDASGDRNNDCDSTSVPTTGVKKIFQTPASFGGTVNGLITVGAIDAIPNKDNKYFKSNFSVWSPRLVEIGAPGAQTGTPGLLSTLPDDNYGRFKGTSMATPLVSGAAALAKLYAKKRGVKLSPMSLEKLIKRTSRKEPLLEEHFSGSNTLDLFKLASEIKENINAYK